MTTYVIMHNMIIEDDRAKNVDHTHYELMGVLVQVARSAHRVARLIASYHCIRFNETHDELQKDLMEEWWKWNGLVATFNLHICFTV
jgi:hypothetical protein